MLTNNLKIQLLEISDGISHLQDYQALIQMSLELMDDTQLTDLEQVKRIDLLLTAYQEKSIQSLEAMSESVRLAQVQGGF